MLILKDLLLRYQKLTSENLFEIISDYYLYDEKEFVEQLKVMCHMEPASEQAIHQLASSLISVATENHNMPLLNQVLSEYQLNQTEGIQLLALAEGLLRIKSDNTANRFIQDKIIAGDWESHKHKSRHNTVNLATEGLAKLKVWLLSSEDNKPFHHWLNTSRNVLAREALKLLISKLATIFIRGSTIQSAISKGTNSTSQCSSYDMLGESALTEQDAETYLTNYLSAINAVAAQQNESSSSESSRAEFTPYDSVSIKLSALTPKFQFRQQQPLQRSFLLRVEKLVRSAHEQSVSLTFDAEESDTLELTLSVFKHCLTLPGLKGWGALGMAIQAYGYRAIPSILFLSQLAKEHETTIPIRLVKGAYWDNEINSAQQHGLANYPVFTQKPATDLNYQACISLLFKHQMEGLLTPQFATHNAVTIATIIEQANELDPEHSSLFPIEFQRLHGMGETIYSALSGYQKPNVDYFCRTYCPVGPYQELLPYLIRRILENGANQSFLNELSTIKDATDSLCELPFHGLVQYDRFREEFPLPLDIYQPYLKGSLGCNINQPSHWYHLATGCKTYLERVYEVHSALPENVDHQETAETLFSPSNSEHRIGICYTVTEVDQAQLKTSLARVCSLATYDPNKRIAIIEQFATKLEDHKHELIALCIREAGKTWQDAVSEIKEAIDFCHYYATQYKKIKDPKTLPGTSNEENLFRYNPKGNFLCISPWNFPVAILVGQVVAALITGNRVLIKPAPQTRISGRRVFDFLRECNVPADSIYFLTLDNQASQEILSNPKVNGVAFTGSLSTARTIQQQLFDHHPYPVPLIAETSGLNCMISDDSILTEQMVRDVVYSAFGAAGQRCSALRVLFIHDTIFNETVEAIKGVMDILTVGDPIHPGTDLGPIIDQTALTHLTDYLDQQEKHHRVLHRSSSPLLNGNYLAPALIELSALTDIKGETFGPILHVIRYRSAEIEQMVQDIEGSEYALTLGIHSRDKHWVDYLCSQLDMGSIYINRHMTGAQVGAQPFGGNKRSGTGFKAGGPNYLLQFVNEQSISENLAAIGGNAQLITKAINPEDK